MFYSNNPPVLTKNNGTNFEKMNSFFISKGLDAAVPTAQYIHAPSFIKGYMEGANSFQEWNINNNYGNNNYKKATLQSPKSLFRLFNP